MREELEEADACHADSGSLRYVVRAGDNSAHVHSHHLSYCKDYTILHVSLVVSVIARGEEHAFGSRMPSLDVSWHHTSICFDTLALS